MSRTPSDATLNVYQIENGEKMKHPNEELLTIESAEDLSASQPQATQEQNRKSSKAFTVCGRQVR